MRIISLRPETGFLRLLWRFVWGPISLIAAFLPLLTLNLLQFPSLLLLPFSRRAFRRYNRTVAFLVWGWWTWGVRHLLGMRVRITGDALPQRENVLLLANHQGMSDILVMLCLAADKNSLGKVTWMVKDVLKYVPGLGWGLVFLEAIFLKRRWADDIASIRATFAKVIDQNIPIWLTMFPEGTRLKASKLRESEAYARSTNRTAMRHVLFPRTKGFVASFHGLKGHVTAVYSLTIGYPGQVPSLAEIVRGDVDEVHLHVRRCAISELPEDGAALAAWLEQDFVLKDELLAYFNLHGYFPSALKPMAEGQTQ